LNFAELSIWAQRQGAAANGPLTQGEFLRRLGIEQRAAALKTGAPPEYAAAIEAALARLTNEERTGMGRMVKAFAVADPKIEVLPGFET
jgi:SAM-dependent MidA family methyltransferase